MRTDIFTLPRTSAPNLPTRRIGRLTARGAIAIAAAGALAVAMAGTASAAPGETDDGSTVGNVAVSSAIALTGLTPSFLLTGLPGATVTGLSAVVFNVETNNIGGYAVTVQSATPTLVAQAPGNTDSIPIGALSVREGGTTAYTAIDSAAAVTVHTQDTRSEENGDDLANDYQVVIPFVNADTYSATLDYIATTL